MTSKKKEISQELNVNEVVNYWIESSDSDYNSMLNMYEKKDYHWALFTGHLLIEKLLKAYYVKLKKKHAPLIHNLLKLATDIGLELTDENKSFLVTVTVFNINARYDDFKRVFYKKCTKKYTDLWIKKIRENREWIKGLINSL